MEIRKQFFKILISDNGIHHAKWDIHVWALRSKGWLAPYGISTQSLSLLSLFASCGWQESWRSSLRLLWTHGSSGYRLSEKQGRYDPTPLYQMSQRNAQYSCSWWWISQICQKTEFFTKITYALILLYISRICTRRWYIDTCREWRSR